MQDAMIKNECVSKITGLFYLHLSLDSASFNPDLEEFLTMNLSTGVLVARLWSIRRVGDELGLGLGLRPSRRLCCGCIGALETNVLKKQYESEIK